jgi:hypothetical protein
MGLFKIFQRKTVDLEKERRERLLRTGRVTEGIIIDTDAPESDEIKHIFYTYSVNGAEYESSQSLDEQQLQRVVKYIPGSKVSVRYDPRQPANSIVV